MSYKCSGGMSGAREGAFMREAWRVTGGGPMGICGMGDDGSVSRLRRLQQDEEQRRLRRLRLSGIGDDGSVSRLRRLQQDEEQRRLRRLRLSGGIGFLPDLLNMASGFLTKKQEGEAAEEARKAEEARARAAKYEADAARASAGGGGGGISTRNLVLGGAAVALTGVLAWSIFRRRRGE